MRRARASPERGPDITGTASSRDGFPSARTKSGVRAAAVLIVLLVVVVFRGDGDPRSREGSGGGVGVVSTGVTRKIIGDGGVDAIWDVPPDAKGTVLALHGCSHDARDWFPMDTSACSECRGLAQELQITNAALDAGYALLAVSSMGHCWSQEDVPRLASALDTYHEANRGMTRKPLYVFGASSGGSLAGLLPRVQLPKRPDGLIIQIMAGPTGGGLDAYPPTVMSHMPKDARTAEYVKASIAELKAAGVKVVEHVLAPRRITDTFFAQESSGRILPSESAGLYVSLRDELGVLDGDGHLTTDPRAFSDAQVETLRTRVDASLDSLVPDVSDVREILNVAYAMHELSAQDFTKNLQWLIDASGT